MTHPAIRDLTPEWHNQQERERLRIWREGERLRLADYDNTWVAAMKKLAAEGVDVRAKYGWEGP